MKRLKMNNSITRMQTIDFRPDQMGQDSDLEEPNLERVSRVQEIRRWQDALVVERFIRRHATQKRFKGVYDLRMGLEG